jgi:hypothetical protein
MDDLYKKNYKPLKKEMEEKTTEGGKIFRVHGWVESR